MLQTKDWLKEAEGRKDRKTSLKSGNPICRLVFTLKYKKRVKSWNTAQKGSAKYWLQEQLKELNLEALLPLRILTEP